MKNTFPTSQQQAIAILEKIANGDHVYHQQVLQAVTVEQLKKIIKQAEENV